jgi:hypothetical protein
MQVAPLGGPHGFGAVVTVTDPAAFDPAGLYAVWQDHGGFLLVRGFVDSAHPVRITI